MENRSEQAIVFGVGPGLGCAIIKRLLIEEMSVAMASRNVEKLESLRDSQCLREVTIYECDVTNRRQVIAVFDAVGQAPDLVVFNASTFQPAGILDIDPSVFEQCWRVDCLGGLHVGQEAARRMLLHRGGTILFTGATASLRGGANFASFSVPKFGLRALAQSMARELGPAGIHVGHVIIDGQIATPSALDNMPERELNSMLDPKALADTYLHLHRQPRTAWTLELDVRPAAEKF